MPKLTDFPDGSTEQLTYLLDRYDALLPLCRYALSEGTKTVRYKGRTLALAQQIAEAEAARKEAAAELVARLASPSRHKQFYATWKSEMLDLEAIAATLPPALVEGARLATLETRVARLERWAAAKDFKG